MNALVSYEMCPNQELQKHLQTIDVQCNSALEHYKSLLAQRGLVLEAFGISLIEITPDNSQPAVVMVTAAVA